MLQALEHNDPAATDRNMQSAASQVPGPMQDLYRNFDNHYGSIANDFGRWPVSRTVFSNSNPHFISRLNLFLLNGVSRISRTLLVGNTSAPAFFFPEIDPDKGIDQFKLECPACGTFIFNTLSRPEQIRHATRFEAEPFMVMDLRPDWKNFDDYLNDLSSKYRVRTRKVYTQSAGFSRQVYAGKEIDESLILRCAQLLRVTLREKTLVMSREQDRVIRNFRDSYGDQYRIAAYAKDGELLAFVSTVQMGNSLFGMQVGYEAEIAKDSHIYQRMLYDILDMAIGLGIRHVNFGRTATEIKSTIGAEPVDNEYLVFVRNPLTRALVRRLAPLFYSKKPFTIRQPFK